MSDRAKHAHGSRKNLDAAIANKIVDSFDVLFLSGEDETPAIGWVDKNGNPIVIAPTDDLAALETQVNAELATKASTESVTALETEMATKANASDVESLGSQIATKADATEVEELEKEVATKVDAETVQSMIEENSKSMVEVVEF